MSVGIAPGDLLYLPDGVQVISRPRPLFHDDVVYTI